MAEGAQIPEVPEAAELSERQETTKKNFDPVDIDVLIEKIDEHAPPDDIVVTQTSANRVAADTFLQTDLSTGLSTAEVARRKRLFGANTLSEQRNHYVKKFLGFFAGPIQYVMIMAAALAGGLQRWIELGVICSLLVLNAVVGFVQEYQAGNVVAMLKQSISLKTTVLRNGTATEIPTDDVVPGDVVLLDEGSVVPADGRIVNANGYVQVDQSTLTGESLVVEKRFGEDVYASSVVKRGEAVAVTTCTGDNTFMGQTARLVSTTTKQGEFVKVLSKIGTALLVLVMIWLTIIWIAGFFRGTSIVTLLTYTLIITVIGVPVGLPAVVTTTLAVGAAQLAKKRVIVQKLAAIEFLAGVDVLCSDKTGTLTQNRLTMKTPFVIDGDVDELLATCALASSRKLKGLDAIDRAILASLKRFPNAKDTVKRHQTTSFRPFDPVSKYVTASVVDTVTGERRLCVKGAPGAVLQMIQDQDVELPLDLRERYESHVEQFAKRGFRTLGVAQKTGDQPWRLLGLIQLYDPPRHDTFSTIQDAKTLGLQLKLLTGDNVAIAREMSRQLGQGKKVYSIRKLKEQNAVQGSEFYDLIEAADGFAEVFPQDKYMVVDVLQKRGHLVAMTGDGVNDAPSLKKADAGIAVEGASQAARTAADIVFLEAGLNAIIEALRTSRKIFHRMRAYVVYRIALSLHLELFFVTTIVIFQFALDPALVVFLAIFCDVCTLAIAYDRSTFSPKPAQWDTPNLWGTSTALGFVLALGTWGMYLLLLFAFDVASPGLVLFLQIALTQNWLIFIARCDGPFWSSWPSWQLALSVLAVDIVATCFTAFGWFGSPVSALTILKVYIYSIGIFVIMSVVYNLLHKSRIFNRLVEPAKHNTLEDLMYTLEHVSLMHERNGNNNGREV